MRGSVQRKLTKGKCAALWRRTYPFEHRPHTGHQLARAERFGDVIITAQFQPQHPVDLIIAGSQENDRHVRGGADPAADLIERWS